MRLIARPTPTAREAERQARAFEGLRKRGRPLPPLPPDEATWAPIPGYAQYEVSAEGVVRNAVTGRVLRQRRSRFVDTYLRVMLHAGRRSGEACAAHPYVHHLVLLAFVGPPPKSAVVHHLNGDRGDNRLVNLVYCTLKEAPL